jgi:hypothetical protein
VYLFYLGSEHLPIERMHSIRVQNAHQSSVFILLRRNLSLFCWSEKHLTSKCIYSTRVQSTHQSSIFTLLECRCPCSSVGDVPIRPDEVEKIERRVQELKANLTVLRNSTSKAIRSKISAYDPRPSAQSIGVILGAGILIFVFGGIVISDLPYFWSLLSCKRRI